MAIVFPGESREYRLDGADVAGDLVRDRLEHRSPSATWRGYGRSTPTPSRLPSSTRSIPGIGAVGLALVEGRLGWREAPCWPVKPRSATLAERSAERHVNGAAIMSLGELVSGLRSLMSAKP
jgi:hypothetical protein